MAPPASSECGSGPLQLRAASQVVRMRALGPRLTPEPATGMPREGQGSLGQRCRSAPLGLPGCFPGDCGEPIEQETRSRLCPRQGQDT